MISRGLKPYGTRLGHIVDEDRMPKARRYFRMTGRTVTIDAGRHTLE